MKSPWLYITGDGIKSRSNGRRQCPSYVSALRATGDAGGVGSSCSSGGTNTVEYSEPDVELDRLWKRLNALKEETPAASTSPPSAGCTIASSSERRGRESGSGRANGNDAIDQFYDREHEMRVHQKEIAGQLEQIQRALTARGTDSTHREERLYTRIKELENYVEVEACKRVEAESRAENLEAGMHAMADRWDLEIAAREAAESNANRCMDLIAEARVAWQKTQVIVENKERELAAADQQVVREAGVSLERRLEDARKAKKLERQHSVALKLALEGSFAAKRTSSSLAATTVPSAKTGHSGSVGNTVKDRRNTLRAAGAIEPLPNSHALSTKGGRVAAAEVRLEAAIEMAATAATSKRINGAGLQRQKVRLEDIELLGQQHGSQTRVSPPPHSSGFDRPELGRGGIRRDLNTTKTLPIASNNAVNGSSDGSGTKLNHGGNPQEGCAVTAPSSAGIGCLGAKEKGKLSACIEVGKEEDTRPRGTMAMLKGKVGSAVKVMNEARNLQVHDSKEGLGAIAALCSISSGFAF
ncbi:unnamed protein product [Pylaiella littoralis]